MGRTRREDLANGVVELANALEPTRERDLGDRQHGGLDQDARRLRTLRSRLPDAVLVVDAGIGSPSDAAQAMELGFDAVLLNSAVALAHDPVVMARAFKLAIEAGRLGYEAGVMAKQDMAVATTPVTGQPFVL